MPATHSQVGPDGPDPTAAPEDETAITTVDGSLRAARVDATAVPAGSATTAGPAAVDWDGLPEAVRSRLAEVAADAVAVIPGSDMPAAVRPLARFTPAKRARLGGSALFAGLRDSLTFRAAVIEWARTVQPGLLDLTSEDTIAAAAAAVLVGAHGAGDRVAEVARRSSEARLRAERDAALAKLERLAEENRRLKRKLDAALAAAQRTAAAEQVDTNRLRSRLREQGVRLREALDRADQLASDRESEMFQARQALAAAEAQRDRERERAEAAIRRAERAVSEAETARQAVREARAADEVRLRLLVDSAADAVLGLRRELGLSEHSSQAGLRPADLVGRGGIRSTVSVRVENPATLDRLLSLPVVHLIVDGYNVTKTGYADLTLADQRDRLTGQLAALAARTGVEVTVVFDGAAVVIAPTTTPRKVRVLFSDPGVLADDVIRELVAAEPPGRSVVVITSDRSLAESVRRCGAYPVSSAVLLARMTRS